METIKILYPKENEWEFENPLPLGVFATDEQRQTIVDGFKQMTIDSNKECNRDHPHRSCCDFSAARYAKSRIRDLVEKEYVLGEFNGKDFK